MGKKTERRNRFIRIRLTQSEYKIVHERFQQSIRKRISDYFRDVLIKGKVTVKQRNSSLDEFMDEMILLRRELNALGNNFNQVVKKINAVSNIPELRSWLPIAKDLQEKLIEKAEGIENRIGEFSDRWLHGS